MEKNKELKIISDNSEIPNKMGLDYLLDDCSDYCSDYFFFSCLLYNKINLLKNG